MQQQQLLLKCNANATSPPRRYMAELLIGLTQLTAGSLQARQLHEEEHSLAGEALPPPIIPGNYDKRAASGLMNVSAAAACQPASQPACLLAAACQPDGRVIAAAGGSHSLASLHTPQPPICTAFRPIFLLPSPPFSAAPV